MRHEERAFFRSRLTANTAREGRPSDEQADLTETQTLSASSSRWNTVPLTFSTLRFRMWGMALSGLLMRTFWILAQSSAEIQVCLFHPGRTLRQLIYRRVQSRLEGGRQSHCRGAAAVDGGAFAAVDERLERQPPPLEQQADAVQA